MKIRIFSIVSAVGILAGGACSCIAQQSEPLDAIVVKIADLQREDSLFQPIQREDGSVCLCLFFERKGKAEVEALREEGLRKNRPVQVVDGTNLIATCKIVGEASSRKPNGEILRYGLTLEFDSIKHVVRVATALSEDVAAYIRRKLNDTSRRGWTL